MATRLEKKSAELMLKKLNAKLQTLFEQQQSDKNIPQQGQNQQLPQFQKGGKFPPPFSSNNSYSKSPEYSNYLNREFQAIYDDPSIGTYGSRLTTDMGVESGLGSVNNKVNSNFDPFANTGFDIEADSAISNDRNPGGVGGVKGEFDWNDPISMGIQAIPSLYNIGKGIFGKTEVENPRNYYNKNRGQANQLMANRRVNVDPQLEAATAAQNTLQGRLRDSGAISSGQYRTNMQSANLGGMRNRASILANKQNQDLGYMGQQAEMLNAQGRDMSQIDMGVGQWNAQNRANKEGYLGQGISDLGQWAGTQQLMRNQQLTDEQRLQILSVFNTNSAKYFNKSYQTNNPQGGR